MTTARGSVLILTLWMIVAFSLIAIGLAERGSSSLRRTERFMQELRGRALAQGAVQHAWQVLKEDEIEDATTKADGTGESWASAHRFDPNDTVHLGSRIEAEAAEIVKNEEIIWRMQDEERLLPLNALEKPQLLNLFSLAGGVKSDEASHLADCILDWRDEDLETRPDGAEDFHYKSATEYESSDAPFTNKEELLLVKGMKPEIYARIAPYVTVYGSGRLNVNTSGELPLKVMGLSDKGVAGVMAYRAGGDGKVGTQDDRQIGAAASLIGELAPYVPANELTLFGKFVEKEVVDVKSTAFHFTVNVPATRPDAAVTLSCVLRRDGVIEAWDEP